MITAPELSARASISLSLLTALAVTAVATGIILCGVAVAPTGTDSVLVDVLATPKGGNIPSTF